MVCGFFLVFKGRFAPYCARKNLERKKDNPPARGLGGWAELLWLSRFFTFAPKC